ncbi:MAG: acyl-CoA/acyl-ACP dehydrogenase [Pseudomonadales bacterium]|nr:acyl-CoA/acyl-ACP dehydrogenase [Pseudomonadales bacterium]
MRHCFTDEHEQFREFVRKFMSTNSDAIAVRRVMETEAGYDADVWGNLSESLGLPGVHIPEKFGGQGFGPVELCIALEEMGRSLLCAPFFGSSVMATTAILNAGSISDKEKLLPDLAAGKLVASLAIAEESGQWEASDIEMTAIEAGGTYRLSGEKKFVLDGHSSDLIVVVARVPGSSGEDGISFFTVKGDAAGLGRRLLNTIDETRKLAVLQFDSVEATPLGEVGAGSKALEKTLVLSYVALANEMMGGAQKLLESAIEYAQMRVQFGRAIGSFQSMKHKFADLLMDVELAKTTAYYAAEAAEDEADDLVAVASMAKAYASDTYYKVAAACIQVHGGIGFTWENDTHLYFKRAKSSEVFLGTPALHRDRLITNWNA